MKLSRTVTYAIQAMLQLAASDTLTPVPCSRLASDGHMPERFLLQILRNLVNHGILRSTRGVEGGYRLGRSPNEISLLDVIEAIDGPLDSKLPTIEGLSHESYAKLHQALGSVASNSRRELEAIKLAHLLPAVRAGQHAGGAGVGASHTP